MSWRSVFVFFFRHQNMCTTWRIKQAKRCFSQTLVSRWIQQIFLFSSFLFNPFLKVYTTRRKTIAVFKKSSRPNLILHLISSKTYLNAPDDSPVALHVQQLCCMLFSTTCGKGTVYVSVENNCSVMYLKQKGDFVSLT